MRRGRNYQRGYAASRFAPVNSVHSPSEQYLLDGDMHQAELGALSRRRGFLAPRSRKYAVPAQARARNQLLHLLNALRSEWRNAASPSQALCPRQEANHVQPSHLAVGGRPYHAGLT